MTEEAITDGSTPEALPCPSDIYGDAFDIPPTEEDELSRLRSELESLRDALNKKEAEQKRILGELEEFSRLFPDTSVKDVPKDVWQNVDRGIPLSAAFALYERQHARLNDVAQAVNQRNAALSAGRAGKDAPREYFSPEEVRAMSQAEVHENYKKIQNSMKHWR